MLPEYTELASGRELICIERVETNSAEFSSRALGFVTAQNESI